MIPDLNASLTAGERIAGSSAPALLLALVLMFLLGAAVLASLVMQRSWVKNRMAEIRSDLKRCEAGHKLCVARGARRTALLLQLMGLTEVFMAVLHRESDRARITAIRMQVEQLLEEEQRDAEAESQLHVSGKGLHEQGGSLW